MREQDLVQITTRMDELLHELEWLAVDEHLYIIKGSWKDKLPWGLGVVRFHEDANPTPQSTHPLFNKLPWNGILGNSKREMGDALAIINAMLIAFSRERESLAHALANSPDNAAQNMRTRAARLAEPIDRNVAMDIRELPLEDRDG